MLPAKACAALIISDEGTGKLDRRGDQQPIRGIAVLQMMQPIAAGSGMVAERHRLDAGTVEKAFNPRLDGNVEVDPFRVDEQRNLPGRDGAEKNVTPVPPALIDQGTG